MATEYEVRSRNRTVSVQRASTAQEALIEYLRSVGCGDDEMVPLGADSVTWRGAVYSAILIEGSASGGENEIADRSPGRAA